MDSREHKESVDVAYRVKVSAYCGFACVLTAPLTVTLAGITPGWVATFFLVLGAFVVGFTSMAYMLEKETNP